MFNDSSLNDSKMSFLVRTSAVCRSSYLTGVPNACFSMCETGHELSSADIVCSSCRKKENRSQKSE